MTLPSPARGLRGRDVLLGPYGSPQSRAEYARVLAEWNVAGATLSRAGNSLTIVELCVAYTEHAMKYYQKDGEPTSQVAAVIAALKFLQQLYGRMPAVEFGPLKLKAWRRCFCGGESADAIRFCTSRFPAAWGNADIAMSQESTDVSGRK